ncbi:hypothetical protein Hypma_006988 [Hypsizygus marmoreus]|uniref:Uncharacterized protein n=1 Tax=Hypsizygus marmoreus TaxID=39966 RepID=A0A369KAF6_HYPMA|nr:hypothetical protein Hypma_006988 [Hypsizygus marmoreus]
MINRLSRIPSQKHPKTCPALPSTRYAADLRSMLSLHVWLRSEKPIPYEVVFRKCLRHASSRRSSIFRILHFCSCSRSCSSPQYQHMSESVNSHSIIPAATGMGVNARPILSTSRMY